MSDQQEARISDLCRSAQERLEPRPRSLDELRQARIEAAAEAEEALRLAEQQWGTNDTRLVPILALLAECVQEVRYGVQDDKPLPHLFRAITIAEASPTRDVELLGGLYRQTGLALRTAGDLEGARQLLERSVKAFEQLGRTGDVCFCVGALARTLIMINPTEALPVCRRYLELEASDEPKSTSHYAALAQLGRCLLLVGDGGEALHVLNEAKTMLLERTKGRPHPWVSELESEIDQAHALIEGKSK
jgi:hypothetical protein